MAARAYYDGGRLSPFPPPTIQHSRIARMVLPAFSSARLGHPALLACGIVAGLVLAAWQHSAEAQEAQSPEKALAAVKARVEPEKPRMVLIYTHSAGFRKRQRCISPPDGL